MRVKIILLLLVLPLSLFSQTKKVSNLENIENRWLTLANDWYFQKGDNLEWAQPEFDDSSWKILNSTNLNMIDSVAIAGDNEIVWFRKYIKIDSLSNTDFVLDVSQQGASEIYLDGKLIHKFGTISKNPKEIINQNPAGVFHALQLVKGKEHLLAVRYFNTQYKYPKNQRYSNTNGYIRLYTTTRSNANTKMALTITDSTFTNQRQQLRKYWRYQKGDNPNWAKADFDDSSWGQFSNYNLNMPDGKAIANDNEIAWFRKRIKADSTLTETIAIEVFQQGASEIYLDGKLIYKLGTVSSNPETSVNRNPSGNFLSLPLKQGKEHVLAVRYVNNQYKYPKNQRFANSNGHIGIWIGTLNYSNAERVLTITDSTLVNQWHYIHRYWRYQKGDDTNWALPSYDDSSWSQFYNTNLNTSDAKVIAENNEIAWFRKPIKADSTLNDAIVLRVLQTGASEIYLDGILIHKLGNISANPEEFEAYNPYEKLLSLPLIKNKEQLLAVRFQSSISTYPIYADSFDGILLRTTSLNNVLNNESEVSFVNDEVTGVINNLYITLGIGLFMFILFLFMYLFFPREKINGYFAVTSLFFTCFVGSIILDFSYLGFIFKYDFAIGFFSIAYLISSLYCIYRIFNKRFGFIFWSFTILCFIGIPALFLISSDYIGPILAVLLLFEMLRISIISLKSEKIGALIFLTLGGINTIYWILFLLNRLNIIQIPKIDSYQPYAYALLPLSIAIYLGYIFGKRSQSLRLNLERVQKLSKEKESILSKQNETLEIQVKERTASLNQSLEELKATQSQLIQSEKMASLGELTAGIAHEIQNPLNFVNNFSEVSNELIDEMNEELDKGDIEEAKAISSDVKQNLEKINHHGKRADSIVKGMLQHSRSSSGTKEPTDINKLTDEYFRLAYHGLRAKDKSFNATLESNYDENIGEIEVIPQDIGRVILNLFTNAFYAVDEKKSMSKSQDYKPTVSVSTEKTKDKILITVKDNGNGIPKEVIDKIFQPFFTTKPTGKGTGLGLSMSYDIIKAHNGELKVETEDKEGTTFKISLPKA